MCESRSANETDAKPTLAELGKNDRVEIDVVIQACFSSGGVDFRFGGGVPMRVDVSEDASDDQSGRGVLVLSAAEVARLDGLLRLYRADGVPCASTTTEDVRVRWFRGGTLVARESFIGSMTTIYDTDDVLLLTTLASWIRPGRDRKEHRETAEEAAQRREWERAAAEAPRRRAEEEHKEAEQRTECMLTLLADMGPVRDRAAEITAEAVRTAPQDRAVREGLLDRDRVELDLIADGLWRWVRAEAGRDLDPPEGSAGAQLWDNLLRRVPAPLHQMLKTTLGPTEDFVDVLIRRVDWERIAVACRETLAGTA